MVAGLHNSVMEATDCPIFAGKSNGIADRVHANEFLFGLSEQCLTKLIDVPPQPATNYVCS